LGLSYEPYNREDIENLTSQELREIEVAIKQKEDQHYNFRIFFTPSLERLIIQQRIVYNNIKIVNWRMAKEKGVLSEYFSGQGQWPEEIQTGRCQYSGDIEDYYSQEGVTSYSQAVTWGLVREYFSGIGLFPEVKKAYLRCRYAGDYDSYIKSLSYEEYFALLKSFGRREAPSRQDYTDAATFIGTACENYADYFDLIKDMPEPIYIPGDGVGMASYICRLLGKQYYSTEPNHIGKEARLVGLIQSDEPYRKDFMSILPFKSVFFGNMVRYIQLEIETEVPRSRSRKNLLIDPVYRPTLKEVVIVDRGGLPDFLYRYPLYPITSYSWTTRQTPANGMTDFFFVRQFNSQADRFKLMVGIDELAVSTLFVKFYNERKEYFFNYDYDLSYRSNLDIFLSTRDKTNKSFDQLLFSYYFDYLKFMYDFTRYTVGRRACFTEYVHGTVVWCFTRDIFPTQDNYLNIYTRAYLNDLKHGRALNAKNVSGDLVIFNPFRPSITNAGYEKVKLKSYDRADTLEHYEEYDGYFYAKVANPLSKKYISRQEKKVRVVYLGTEEGISKYRTAASYSYKENRQNTTEREDSSSEEDEKKKPDPLQALIIIREDSEDNRNVRMKNTMADELAILNKLLHH
jgi:hypothetical protein